MNYTLVHTWLYTSLYIYIYIYIDLLVFAFWPLWCCCCRWLGSGVLTEMPMGKTAVSWSGHGHWFTVEFPAQLHAASSAKCRAKCPRRTLAWTGAGDPLISSLWVLGKSIVDEIWRSSISVQMELKATWPSQRLPCGLLLVDENLPRPRTKATKSNLVRSPLANSNANRNAKRKAHP